MTQDEIIRMAREAGIVFGYPAYHDRIERFAALVAAHEREACAKVCDTEDIHRGNWYAAAIRNRGEK